jgi:hypothetical protein
MITRENLKILQSWHSRKNFEKNITLSEQFQNTIETWISVAHTEMTWLHSDIFLYEKNDQVIMTPCNEIKDYLSFGVHKSSLALPLFIAVSVPSQ